MADFHVDGENNDCQIGEKVQLTGWIKGCRNRIVIDNALHECKLELRINGNNNTVVLRSPFAVKSLQIRVGNHVPANSTILEIDEGFSIEGSGQFFLYNSGNKLAIGKNCMFSNNVTVRCGDSPHLLFDSQTGEYLDISEGVNVGDHVWVGERAYITKKVTIPSECVVAACSVVTRRFASQNCVIAGNPAKVVRENVQWIRNRGYLEPGSRFKSSYDDYWEKFT